MKKYTKIQTVFKRCTDNGPNKNKIIEGDWTLSEFETLKDVAWDATEKVDGTNTSVIWDGGRIQFAGREESAQLPVSLVNYLIETFTADKFKALNLPPMIVFGEGYGAGIQKVGKEYLPDSVSFISFDVWCGDLWLERDAVDDVSMKLGIGTVPFGAPMTLSEAVDMVAAGFVSKLGCGPPAEGLVLRAPHGMLTRRGERLITKIKTRDFAK